MAECEVCRKNKIIFFFFIIINNDEEDSLDNFKYESKEKKADNSNIIAFSELYDNLYQLKKEQIQVIYIKMKL